MHQANGGMRMLHGVCREAAVRGGGGFVAPVQRVTDFMAGEISNGALPSSSYRLGVRSSALHDIYSPAITAALQAALQRFDRQLPGFLSPEGLLHGVETRTSSPLQIGALSPMPRPVACHQNLQFPIIVSMYCAMHTASCWQ